MPAPDTVLIGLTTIANEWKSIAIAWHVALAAVLLALLLGWRPSNRVAACVLAAPLLSVSVAAWASGNPFNGTVFALLLFTLLGIGGRLSSDHVHFAGLKPVVAGALLVGFGWVYPHFLRADNWTTYTYAAPLGVLPCPTLSAVIGGSLMLGLFGSSPWSAMLVTAGLAYGAIGVFVLGVELDYVLLAGALVLALGTWAPSRRPRPANQKSNGKKVFA